MWLGVKDCRQPQTIKIFSKKHGKNISLSCGANARPHFVNEEFSDRARERNICLLLSNWRKMSIFSFSSFLRVWFLIVQVNGCDLSTVTTLVFRLSFIGIATLKLFSLFLLQKLHVGDFLCACRGIPACTGVNCLIVPRWHLVQNWIRGRGRGANSPFSLPLSLSLSLTHSFSSSHANYLSFFLSFLPKFK